MPEARLNLAQAVIALARGAEVQRGHQRRSTPPSPTCGPARSARCPPHLRDAHYGGAKKLGHGTGLPVQPRRALRRRRAAVRARRGRDAAYYQPTELGAEAAVKERWERLRRIVRGGVAVGPAIGSAPVRRRRVAAVLAVLAVAGRDRGGRAAGVGTPRRGAPTWRRLGAAADADPCGARAPRIAASAARAEPDGTRPGPPYLRASDDRRVRRRRSPRPDPPPTPARTVTPTPSCAAEHRDLAASPVVRPPSLAATACAGRCAGEPRPDPAR